MFTASGTIRPSRFVKISGAYTLAECDAGEAPFGISDSYTNAAPIPSVTNEYHAISGEAVSVLRPGSQQQDRPVLLTLGSGGATAGQLLKSDADGQGVVAGSDKDCYGARALETGSAGETIRVEPLFGYIAV